MRRPTYVCATCSEHFTRRYSATRHNLTLHNGRGEIVTYIEYLVGRNSGQYRPSHPSLYRRGRGEKRMHNFGHATTTAVADSIGDTFRHRGMQGQYDDYSRYQQQAPSIPLPSLPPATQDVSSYRQDQISIVNDKGTLLSLSQETALKIRELKKLVYRYHIFSNPDLVIECATYFSMSGDNTFLDEKLEQLRMLDNTMG